QVNTTGSYTVTVTDPTGCSSSFVSNVAINPLPQLSFTVSNACLGATTNIVNTSTIAAGSIMTWNWNFGDASFSSLQNPAHNYGSAGNYNVTLTAQSAMGCVSTISQPVAVYQLPDALFTAPPVCEGAQTLFTDASTSTGGNINFWNWSFGDGQTSGLQSPQHTYATAGFWPVTQTIVTVNGCSDTYNGGVTVHPMPQVQFNMQDVCEGLPVQFNNTSNISSGSITNWSWNLGDGSSSTLTNPAYTYGTPLTYNVTLTATSNEGCVANNTLPVTIHPAPRAMGSVLPVCKGEGTQFANQSTIITGSIASNYWNFGDNGSSNAVAPSHTYGSPGLYNTLLVVTSDFGCVDSFTIPTIVNVLPDANFMNNGSCLGTQTQMTDLSVVPSGSITAWDWLLGDGTGSSQQ
ncbi:MAG: PKD domain-containing protein, partial [Bacteroidota bacterium]